MAGSPRRVLCRRTIPALLLSTLVALTLPAVVRAPGPAGADQVATLKAQATAISQKLIQEQLQVEAYQQQYSVASARTAAEEQAIAAVGQQVAQDQAQISARTALVRTEAIRAYTDFGTGSAGVDAALFSGNEEKAQAASEYSAIAVGNITTALDQLRAAQRSLQGQEASLRHQRQQDQIDQGRQATYLGQAGSTESQLTSLHASVTGQLATAVAQQAAAQSAAAASAVATAQKAAAKSASTRTTAPTATTAASSQGGGPTTTAPTAVDTSTNTTDPALNPFLQCVVQAESGGNYGAVSPDGLYMGAFQFSQPTWNTAARAAGRPDLVGVPPNRASKADQDTVAVALYALDGERPWLGDRCSA